VKILIDASSQYYLFTWVGYESGGIEQDCVGAFGSLEDAMKYNGLREIGCIVGIRNDGLRILAEYDGWPPDWKLVNKRLGK